MLETSGGVYAQNEIEWTPWLRTMAGLRGDAVALPRRCARRRPTAARRRAGLVSPKGGATLGPVERHRVLRQRRHGLPQQRRARHDDHARSGRQPGRPRHAARAREGRRGRRAHRRRSAPAEHAVACGRCGSTPSWCSPATTGTTEPSRPSARRGVEWTNYYSPTTWLVFDGDLSWSRARFTEFDPVGDYVPEAVGTVVSAGATRRRTSTRVRQPALALLRPARRSSRTTRCGRRRRPSSISQAGYQAREERQAGAGRLQPVQRGRQRHRLLLRVAAAGRAARRRRRHPHASDPAAHGACKPGLRLLSATSHLACEVAACQAGIDRANASPVTIRDVPNL